MSISLVVLTEQLECSRLLQEQEQVITTGVVSSQLAADIQLQVLKRSSVMENLSLLLL